MKQVAIFAGGQSGDVMTAMSVLKYRNELWGDNHKITWFINPENRGLLYYHDDIELLEFPRGFGYPEMTISENKKLVDEGKKPVWLDLKPLVDESNHLNLSLKNNYHLLEKFDVGYFPLPHQISVEKRLEYPLCSKKVFGIEIDLEWHPVLKFSDEEKEKINEYIDLLPKLKNVAIETFAGSGQSILSDSQIKRTIELCRSILGDCNIVLVSHKYLNGNEEFPQWLTHINNLYAAVRFNVRECALLVAKCQLFISVSSGISVAAQCWENKGKVPPILQYCGSKVCSTQALSSNKFELVETYNKTLDESLTEYESKLIKLLKEINE